MKKAVKRILEKVVIVLIYYAVHGLEPYISFMSDVAIQSLAKPASPYYKAPKHSASS